MLIALALAGCSSGKKTSEPDAKTTEPKVDESAPVTLAFDWPEGLSGSVKRDQMEQMAPQPEETSTVTYTLTTKPLSGGVELTYSEPRDAAVPGVSDEELGAMAPMFEAVPTILLKDGKVVSIGNAAAMRAIVDELAPIPADAPADIKAQMEATRSDEFFLQAAQSEWATLTTVWHNQTLTPGEGVEVRSQSPLLGLPTPIETVIRMKLVEWLACPGAAERRCVRLEYSSTPDPASLQKATDTLVHNAARQGVKFEIQSLERTFEVDLVTEPSTLVPHTFSSREVTKLEATQNGQPASTSKIKVRTETYRWESAKP